MGGISASNVCWECIKGRHSLCNGMDDPDPIGSGKECGCPISHEGNPSRQPSYDRQAGVYVDPGPDAERDRENT